MSAMESNCPEPSVINDNVESAIDRLQTVLHKNYLAAERVMALRSHNTDALKTIGDTINVTFNELLGVMSSAKAEPKAIVDLSQNKHEFDVRCSEWLAKVNVPSDIEPASDEIQELLASKPTELLTQNDESCTLLSTSKRRSRDTGSSNASAKRLAAEAKLRVAQLEAAHLEERAEEQRRMAEEQRRQEEEHRLMVLEIEQREARRKIALAEVECEVWSNSSSTHSGRSIKTSFSKLPHQRPKVLPNKVTSHTDKVQDKGSKSMVTSQTRTERVLDKGSIVTDGTVTVHSVSKPQGQPGPSTYLTNADSCLVHSSVRFSQPPTSHSTKEVTLNPNNFDKFYPPYSAINLPVNPAPLTKQLIPSISRSKPLIIPQTVSSVCQSRPCFSQKGVTIPAFPYQSDSQPFPSSSKPMANISSHKILEENLNERASVSNSHVVADVSQIHFQPPLNLNTTQPFPMSSFSNPLPDQAYSASNKQKEPSVLYPNASSRFQHEYENRPSFPYLVNPTVSYDGMFLPRPEFPKFSGDPLEFKSFINNFEIHIEPRIQDERMKFSLLLQHCDSSIRDRIEHFADFADNCYLLAKNKLQKEYGSPWIISDVCERKLKNFPVIKSGDAKQLKCFSELLEKTTIIIRNIRQYTSLDSLDTLSELVSKLPFDLRKRWVKRSVQIENSTRLLANFYQFVEFVSQESLELNSLFGMRSLSIKSTKATTKIKASSYGVITSTSSKTFKPNTPLQPGCCWFCKDSNHKLPDCGKFKNISVQKRSEFVKTSKLCHKCLSSKHRTPECKRSKTCAIEGCTGSFHHTILHRPASDGKEKSTSRDVGTSTVGIGVDIPATCAFANRSQRSLSESSVYLCIIPVKVTYNGKCVTTYAFLDQGSTHSFCDKSLVEALDISGPYEHLNLKTILGTLKGYKATSCELTVSGLHDEMSFTLPSVHSIEEIPVQPNVIPVKSEALKLPHLSGVKLDTLPHSCVNLLIGADVPELFCISNSRKGPRGTPCAIETPLGWSLLGPSLSPSFNRNCQVNFLSKGNVYLNETIEKMWKTEFDDGTSTFDTPNSKEDRHAYKIMQSSISEADGHYQLPLLWKENCKNRLPNNLPLAQRRLFSLKKRLMKDTVLKERYTKVINDYLKKGYARKVPQNEITNNKDITWYLPHHPVTNVHKPDKVRVVFDCAAKYNGVSLNDALMAGPPLMNTLTGVLIRFRKEKIALMGDVESMFHQVKVDPVHINALRFLWWENGDMRNEPEIHQMLVHIFGATSSPSCANFSLRQTAVEFGHQHKPSIAEIVHHNFYVDDCLVSFPSVEEAITARKELKELLARRGFNLTKWTTNDTKVLDAIPNAERSKKAQHLLDGSSNDRVLGVQWRVKEDKFTFDVNLPQKPCTRRGILSTIASLYDPLGFAAPVTLEGKLILQSLCKQKAEWDQHINEQEIERWTSWLSQLSALNEVQIERCFKPDSFGPIAVVQIHNFADASCYAYGASSYLRLIDDAGNVSCSFLLGKSRVAPIKAVSIPRLELTAAVLAVRLDVLVRKELTLPAGSDSFYWTDSTAVLFCIRNQAKRFPVFVANRLAVIETNSDVNRWRHVPSTLNPADSASRGLPANTLNTESWLKGPKFLLSSESDWPDLHISTSEAPAEFSVKEHAVHSTVKLHVTDGNSIDRLTNRYSNFYKLKRVVAWILKFISTLRHRKVSKKFISTNELTVEELKNAELSIIKYVQHRHFPYLFPTISSLHAKSKPLPRFMQKLRPISVDGVLRVGGRIAQAPVDDDVKHPIILPRHSHITELVIRQHHVEVGHSGTSHTWASIRRRYWIVKGGAAVRQSIGKCIKCKKRNAVVGKQLMADIPACRLQSDKPPFHSVGIDYFGPLMVKQGRSLVKRYGCVFTCLTMRAIHIEISHSLSTDSFLNALRRFIARRGKPAEIHSDNGSNFIGAERILRESLQSLDQRKLNDYCSQLEIKWKFNPPYASHMGGAWERMIRSIRKILKSLIETQTVNDEGLVTLITEVESIINSRPLVPVLFDAKSDSPLTPNHLLLFRDNPNLPPGLFDENDCYARRRWAQIQYLSNQFWRRWLKEFLPNLNNRQKWFQASKNFEVGDIVLLAEDLQQRSKWVLGRIVKTFPDRRGLVRTVQVKTQSNVLTRPISKLCSILERHNA